MMIERVRTSKKSLERAGAVKEKNTIFLPKKHSEYLMRIFLVTFLMRMLGLDDIKQCDLSLIHIYIIER